jgi:hypothetical protein
MKYLVIIALTGLVTMFGCGQGAEDTPSGSTDSRTSPVTSRDRATTAEQTTSIHRFPAHESRGVLECREDSTVGAVFDYARGVGEPASPVEQARRRFSERIEEGDAVEVADRLGEETVGYYGEELRTVRVVRNGRLVALIYYKEGRDGGGRWLLGSYEACGEF